MTHTIEGIFRLTRPLHCASQSLTREVADKDGNTTKKAITETMKMPVVTKDIKDTVPYFPGNDLRGRLRRFAARAVADAVTADGSRMTRGLYSGLTSGAEGARPDGAPLTVEEVHRQRSNVFMGVFGGGARMLRSAYRAYDLVPVIRTTVEAGMVPARFADGVDGNWLPSWRDASSGESVPVKGYQLLHEYTFVRVDDVFSVVDVAGMSRYLADAGAEVAAWQQGTLENKEDRRASKAEGEETKKTGIANRLSFEAIPAGTPMYFRIEFEDRLVASQRGLIFQAVCDLVNAQNLGGWIRAGLGTFVAELTYDNGEDVVPLLDNFNGEYRVAQLHAPAMEQYREALASLAVSDLEPFYTMRSPKENEDKSSKKRTRKTTAVGERGTAEA